MIHAIIVDDELKVLRSLELIIAKFVPEIRVVASTTNPLDAVRLVDDYRPDLLLLDISMPGLDGFELLDRLTFRNFHLVFTTAHEEYAVQAIRNSALDYLLKPIDTAELQMVVEKIKRLPDNNLNLDQALEVLKSITTRQNHKIALPGKVNTEYLSPEDILYIEASTRYCDVATIGGKMTRVLKSLKEFEEQLCPKYRNFMRVQQSFIVNLDHVTRYTKENGGQIVMQGKKHIPVSKQKKVEVLKFFDIS